MAAPSTNLSLHGTILSVEAGGPGPDGVPRDWVYVVGHHLGDVTRVVSAWPLAADAGDDLKISGLRVGNPDDKIQTIRLERPPRVLPRFAAQFDEAELKTFGQATDKRPGFVAAAALKLRLVLGRARKGNHCIVRAADKPGDPILTWAAKMFADVLPESPIFLIDPLAFDHGWSPVMGTRADRAVAAMKDRLPAMLGFETARIGRDLTEHPSGNTVLFNAKGGVPGPALVQPYNPYETTAGKFRSYSRLPATAFQPRRTIAPEWRQRYTVAHELAHTVQHRYGLGRVTLATTPAQQHRMECFADCFALLTLASAGAPPQVMQDMVDFRRLGLAAAPTGYFTAPVGDAALAEIAAGAVIGQSTAQLLQLAGTLTAKHALSDTAFADLDHDRKFAMMRHGVAGRDSHVGSLVALIRDGDSARLAMAAAAQTGGPLSQYWPEFEAAVDRLVVSPNHPAAEAHAAADLSETLSALPPGDLSLKRVLEQWLFVQHDGTGSGALTRAAKSLTARAGKTKWPTPDMGVSLIRPRKP